MARELAGSQISALLEAVPGIANVLRSPVADALVHMIRAGARLEEFQFEHAKELTQYAERRGLVGANEAEELLADVSAASKRRRSARAGDTKPRGSSRAKPKARPKPRPAARKAGKGPKGSAKAAGRPVKKAASKKRR